jgi:hypothetical protein
MTARRGSMDAICFAAEGMAGTAAASTLRRFQSLADAAPAGRLFAAITTLTEMSAKAAKSLEDGSAALGRNDDHAATVKLSRAITQMDDLASAASGTTTESSPGFLRRAR